MRLSGYCYPLRILLNYAFHGLKVAFVCRLGIAFTLPLVSSKGFWTGVAVCMGTMINDFYLHIDNVLRTPRFSGPLEICSKHMTG